MVNLLLNKNKIQVIRNFKADIFDVKIEIGNKEDGRGARVIIMFKIYKEKEV